MHDCQERNWLGLVMKVELTFWLLRTKDENKIERKLVQLQCREGFDVAEI